MTNIDQLIKRWKTLKAEKSEWHNHYDDLARVYLPRRLGFASTIISGQRRTEDIFDGTPMQAARGLANAISGLMRPEGLPAVRMKTDSDELDQMEEVQIWLADSEVRMRDEFNRPKARFRQASSEKDLDLIVFGTAAMFIGETNDSLLFQSIHLKDITPFFTQEGVAEGMFRERNPTVRQLADRFGKERLAPETLKKLENKPEDKIRVLHAVVPRKGAKVDPLFAKDLPFSDLWIEIEEKHILSEGGFHEFPFIVPRWDTTSGEDLGRSPGMIALPDSDTLQAMGETILIAGQRAADPPLAVPNDGSFSSVNTFPGGLVYYDVETASELGGNPFFSMESGTNLPITRDMQQDLRSQVFNAFFRNVLNLPVEGPQMTATEVIQRKEEFIREIGATFGKLETDDTAPTVERVFMIMLRNGGFADIPEILQGQNIRFEYDSPTKRIRQQVEASSAELWVNKLINLSQSKPEAMDLINVEEYGRFTAEAMGIPNKIVNSAETIQEIQQARAEAEAQAEQMEGIQQMADLAETAAKAGNLASPE